MHKFKNYAQTMLATRRQMHTTPQGPQMDLLVGSPTQMTDTIVYHHRVAEALYQKTQLENCISQ